MAGIPYAAGHLVRHELHGVHDSEEAGEGVSSRAQGAFLSQLTAGLKFEGRSHSRDRTSIMITITYKMLQVSGRFWYFYSKHNFNQSPVYPR